MPITSPINAAPRDRLLATCIALPCLAAASPLRCRDGIDVSADVAPILCGSGVSTVSRQLRRTGFEPDVAPPRGDGRRTRIPGFKGRIRKRLIARARGIHEDVLAVRVGRKISRQRPDTLVSASTDAVLHAF